MGLCYHFETAITFANLIPFTQIRLLIMNKLFKTPVRKDLITIVLFKTSEHLK